MKKKTTVFWISDSGGNISCHRNGKGLSFKESQLGYLVARQEQWWYYLIGETEAKGPFETVAACKSALLIAVNGDLL